MSAKHTPGPWVAHPSDSPDWFLVSAGSSAGRLVANVNRESCPDSSSAPAFVQMPAEANANLIAAAPDLLAECRTDQQWIENLLADIASGRPLRPERIAEGLKMRHAKLSATIAKAEGAT